ncbi:hypothetical protein YPPY89_4945 [Yersinia pestis PY-89]|nr:hypothetical protein YPPY89_4945 [Yersinia pestis PY-89]
MEFAIVEVQIANLNFTVGDVSSHTHQDFSLLANTAEAAFWNLLANRYFFLAN